MSYQAKCTLIFTLILIVMIGLFYNSISKLNKEIASIEELLQKTENERDDLKKQGFQPDTLKVQFHTNKVNYMENWTIEHSKYFLKAEDSKVTWEYLQGIVNRFDDSFQFNFQQQAASRGQGQIDYAISGTHKIMYLYIFINYIEKLGALFTIESVTINNFFRETPTGPQNDVHFNMIVRPHVDANMGKDILQTPMRRIDYAYIMKDPMRPAIHNPMKDPEQDRFVDSETLELFAFTTNRANFTGANQVAISLTPMQRVAYGYFSHVDERNRRAVFRINRTGLYETIYKKIDRE